MLAMDTRLLVIAIVLLVLAGAQAQEDAAEKRYAAHTHPISKRTASARRVQQWADHWLISHPAYGLGYPRVAHALHVESAAPYVITNCYVRTGTWARAHATDYVVHCPTGATSVTQGLLQGAAGRQPCHCHCGSRPWRLF